MRNIIKIFFVLKIAERTITLRTMKKLERKLHFQGKKKIGLKFRFHKLIQDSKKKGGYSERKKKEKWTNRVVNALYVIHIIIHS